MKNLKSEINDLILEWYNKGGKLVDHLYPYVVEKCAAAWEEGFTVEAWTAPPENPYEAK